MDFLEPLNSLATGPLLRAGTAAAAPCVSARRKVQNDTKQMFIKGLNNWLGCLFKVQVQIMLALLLYF